MYVLRSVLLAPESAAFNWLLPTREGRKADPAGWEWHLSAARFTSPAPSTL